MKKIIILLLFIILKFVIQYVIIGPDYDLHRDEFLHLDQGKHLAWGYLSVPPFSSWTSWLILSFGNSEFWVRFFPALYGALTLVVVWKAIEALHGEMFALVLGACAVTFSVLLRINMLYQPNSFDILCWTLLYYAVLRYMQTGKKQWLYTLALVLAIGFLNKYNIIFQLAGLIPALIITNRRIFADKHLYFAGMLAFFIVLPNLIWQYQNEFPVIHHMKLLSETQLVNVSTGDFLKEQFLFFMGSIFVLIAALVSFFRYPPHKKFQVFFWAFAFTLFLFIYLKAKGYYAIGLYPFLLSFGSVYLEKLLTNKIKWLRPVAFAAILLCSILLFRVGFPMQSPEVIAGNAERYKNLGLLRWEDGKDHTLPQDFADMLGWKELAAKVDSTYANLEDKANTIVLCDNYGQAGAINYYSRSSLQAVTMNADYINWIPLEQEIQNVILVQDADDDDKDRKKEQLLFRKIELTGKVENHYAREYGTRVYALTGAKVSINKILKSDIEENRWH